MGEANNETPTGGRCRRVGLIADADEAPRYAAALRTCSELELGAQAGMPQRAGLAGVPWFDDTRVLIAQGEIEALVVAASPRAGVAIGEVAAAHGVHVWRPPPLGRNFAEAIETARRLETVDSVYRVASWWDHVGEEIRWGLGFEAHWEPVFSEVQVSASGPPLTSWRSSRANAAGGVLASDAYASLEALIAVRGLPESVQAALGKCRRRPSEAPRETEEVAVAILRYEEGLALVRASWDIPPFSQITRHHGNQFSLRYTGSSVAVLAVDGSLLEERPLPTNLLTTEMARLAAEIGDEDRREHTKADINRHVAISAFLEAAYLSARTGQPETPRRFFEVQKWPEPEQ